MRKIGVILIVTFVFMTFTSGDITFASRGICIGKLVEEGEVINDICPVMGGEVDKDTSYTTVYKGKKIGFCCPGCIEKFNADPVKYMEKLQKTGENLICVTEGEISCPILGNKVICSVTGEAFNITEESEKSVCEGRVCYFCCPGCKIPFEKNPEKYLKEEKKEN